MYTQRGRRRKIESIDLSEFGVALEDILSAGDFSQKDVAIAGGLADSTLSQMKVGARMTRDNVRKLLLGLIRIKYVTPDNFDQISAMLLELAGEKPLNKDHKKDAHVIALLQNLHSNGANNDNIDELPFEGKPVIIVFPETKYMMAPEGERIYRAERM